MEHGREEQGESETLGVRKLPGEGQRRVPPLQGLIRSAKAPQSLAHMAQTGHSSIVPVAEDMGAMLLRIVERNRLFEVGAGWGELSQIEQGLSQRPVYLQEEGRVLYAVSQL